MALRNLASKIIFLVSAIFIVGWALTFSAETSTQSSISNYEASGIFDLTDAGVTSSSGIISLAVSQDGTKIFSISDGNNSVIYVTEISTGQTRTLDVPLGAIATKLVAAQDRSTIFVESTNKIFRLDPATESLELINGYFDVTFGDTLREFAVTEDQLLVGIIDSFGQSIQSLNPITGEKSNKISGNQFSLSNADGNQIYATRRTFATVEPTKFLSAYEISSAQITATVETSVSISTPPLSIPDAKIIAMANCVYLYFPDQSRLMYEKETLALSGCPNPVLSSLVWQTAELNEFVGKMSILSSSDSIDFSQTIETYDIETSELLAQYHIRPIDYINNNDYNFFGNNYETVLAHLDEASVIIAKKNVIYRFTVFPYHVYAPIIQN